MNVEALGLAGLFVAGIIAAIVWMRAHARREAKDSLALAQAKAEGRNIPSTLHPIVNTDTCMGSYSCLKVCPEGDILGVVNGKAALIDASACIGHGKCAAECPVDAITLVFGTSERGLDLPEVDEFFQTNRPGLHIVGELGGMGLIKNALTQGLQVATHLKTSLHGTRKPVKDQVDVAIVGAGPAGLATALGLKKEGITFRVLEQDTVGGTIAHYPRQKVVMTEKVVLPFVGRFGRSLISKEQLLEGWKHAISKADLKVEEGTNVTGISGEDGAFLVTTNKGIISAKKVVLAIGRRGTPRKLGVPGEDLPNVTYRMIDATQYEGTKVLIVGGSDSALEAAIQIAEETNAKVTLSYRQDKFGRGREANKKKFAEMVAAGKIRALMPSTIKEVNPDWVRLEYAGRTGKMSNDFVIACLGGELPAEFLKKSGVTMRRLQGEEMVAKAKRGSAKKDEIERASRRFASILFVIGATIIALLTLKGWTYYQLPAAERVKDAAHAALKPSGPWGHGVGIVATLVMMSNFVYALRKRWTVMKGTGSIRNWLTFHQFVGFMSPLVIAFHATFRSNNALASATTASLAVVVATGVIGRFIIRLVPTTDGKTQARSEVVARWEKLKERMAARVEDKTEVSDVRKARELLDKAVVPAQSPSLLKYLAGLPFRQVQDRMALGALAVEFPSGVHYREFRQSFDELRTLQTQVTFYGSIRVMLGIWRVFHVILAILLVAMITAHIAVSLFLGYKWIFS